MNRKATIATVSAATVAFAATVVATVSIMQATVAVSASDELPALVTATTQTGEQNSDSNSDLSFTPPPLPELPKLAGSNPKSQSLATTATATESEASVIDRNSATAAVLAATPGTVIKIAEFSSGSTQAFAITVKRSDGSVVTGYVDRSSGVVYEWVVNQKAPKPAAESNTYYEDDDHDDDHEEHDDDHDEDDDDDDDDDDERDHDDD